MTTTRGVLKAALKRSGTRYQLDITAVEEVEGADLVERFEFQLAASDVLRLAADIKGLRNGD